MRLSLEAVYLLIKRGTIQGERLAGHTRIRFDCTEELLTVQELRKATKLCSAVAYKRIAMGFVPGVVRVGKIVRIRRSGVELFKRTPWLRAGAIGGGELLTVEEFAEAMHLNVATARTRIRSGAVPGVIKLGKAVRIRRAAIDDLKGSKAG